MVHFEDDTRDRRGAMLVRGEKASDRVGWFDWLYRLFGARYEALIGILALLFGDQKAHSSSRLEVAFCRSERLSVGLEVKFVPQDFALACGVL